jgi:L-ascorbate 6-phosphate lactonase
MTSPLDRLREVPTGTGRAALSWLGQAGFVVRGAGGTALVDPFLSPYEGRRYESALRGEDCTDIDVVLCTHEHVDHFDSMLAPVIARMSPDAVFVVPTPIVDMVTEVGIAPDRVVGLQPGGSWEGPGLGVRAVPARHGVTMEDAYGFGEALSDGLVRFLGYVLEVDGVRIYHAGDTIHFEGMESTVRALRPDVALLPINGRDAEREARGIVGNLTGREAAWLAQEVGAGVLVPMHHDLFAGNRGWPAHVVEWVEREDRDITVVVPPRETPFVVTGGRA